MDVVIVGAGIGGLTLALMLHERGIPTRVYEAAPDIRPIGVGITLLPHATQELAPLGIVDALTDVGIPTEASCFFNRFGQSVHREVCGRAAGYDWPQVQIHRGDLQQILYRTYVARAGAERVVTGRRCVKVDQDGDSATAHFVDAATGAPVGAERGAAVIACDGIHSVLRRQLYPDEGPPIYSGVNMWRGAAVWDPFLGGASYMRAGWLTGGKMVIYPIRDNVDGHGRQLVNWVAEVETPNYNEQDWNKVGRLDDFIDCFADWTFDFLDVPGLIRASDPILEYPMVDRDPLPRWSVGRMTLLGDAAHPMYPRGSNGAGQAILDARALADRLAAEGDAETALAGYDDDRREAAARVVESNRTVPPDVILKIVYERTGDKPFERIEDVISAEEIARHTGNYKKIAGYDRDSLAAKVSAA